LPAYFAVISPPFPLRFAAIFRHVIFHFDADFFISPDFADNGVIFIIDADMPCHIYVQRRTLARVDAEH